MHSPRVFRIESCATARDDAAHLLWGGVLAVPLHRCHQDRPALRLTASRGASSYGGA